MGPSASKAPQSKAAKQPVREVARAAQIRPRPGAALHAALSFANHIGNRGMGRWLAARGIQAKLVVGPNDDHYEQEADRIADRVLRMPAVGDTAALSISALGGAPVQRLCSECEEEKLQRESVGSSFAARNPGTANDAYVDISPALEADIHALRASGESLPHDV